MIITVYQESYFIKQPQWLGKKISLFPVTQT